MIDAVVFIEQTMGLVSFRPLMRLPTGVSALGFAPSLVAMFVIESVFSLAAIAEVPANSMVILETTWVDPLQGA